MHTPPLPPQPSDAASHAFESDWLATEAIARKKRVALFAGLFVAGTLVSTACAALANVKPPAIYFFGLAGGLAMAAFASWFPTWFADASARGFIAFLAPNQGLAPGEATYSHIQAMAVRGDVVGALREYESVIAADPTAVEARVQAAELYATSRSDPGRAAMLYSEVRRIPGVAPERDLYASQRLIDLYDGPLRQPAKSLTELRRIIDRHYGTREAEYARTALAKRRRDQSRGGAQ